jgi:hypothetical protein
MLGALVRLTLWSVRNRFRSRLRRLREPRYLIGSIVGAVWLYGFVLRSAFRGPRPGRPQMPSPFEALASHSGTVLFAVALVLFVAGLLIALVPGRRRPLEFSPAEVQFLFPAPITRRQLLHYKLVRSQGGLLFGTAIATLLLRPGTLHSGWMFLVGFWIALTACRLYSIGVGLDRDRPARRRAGRLGAARGLAAVWLAALVVLGAAAAADGPRLGAMATAHDVFEELRRIWSTGAPRIVLWPFVTLARLPLAPSIAAFLTGLPGALLIAVLAYAWVMRTGTALEDAPDAPAESPGAAPSAGRQAKPTGSRQPFKLALEGRPEIAILWKNLILAGRYASLSTLLRILPLVLVLAVGARGGGRGAFAVTICFVFALMLLLLGPIMARNDLRQDLTRLAVLKSWPVSGASIVRGELLAPALLLSVLEWLLLGAGAILLRSVPIRTGARASVLLAHLGPHIATAMLLAPALILAQLVVQNGIAVLFPAWMILGKSRVRGVEGMGQQMLMTWGGLLLAVLFLAPPAAGAAIVMFAVYSATHTIVVLPAAAVLLALLVAESLVVTGWLGRVLDRTDLAAVDPVE